MNLAAVCAGHAPHQRSRTRRVRSRTARFPSRENVRRAIRESPLRRRTYRGARRGTPHQSAFRLTASPQGEAKAPPRKRRRSGTSRTPSPTTERAFSPHRFAGRNRRASGRGKPLPYDRAVTFPRKSLPNRVSDAGTSRMPSPTAEGALSRTNCENIPLRLLSHRRISFIIRLPPGKTAMQPHCCPGDRLYKGA